MSINDPQSIILTEQENPTNLVSHETTEGLHNDALLLINKHDDLPTPEAS